MNNLEFKTLENTGTSDILDCFNLAFSDYKVPTKLALSQLENKIMSENILKEYSIGAFDNGRLVGFILHGYDLVNNREALYNAGTGVIPEYRGQKITERMYAFGIPGFKAAGIKDIYLEVITDNLPAVTVYKRIGFQTIRTVDCYRGNISAENKEIEPVACIIESCDWAALQNFWDFKPTWQNSVKTILRNKANLEMWCIRKEDEIKGYLVYIPDRKRIQQFAVHPDSRRKKFASSLFNHIASLHGTDVGVINVDENNEVVRFFLHSLGLEDYLQQFEMRLTL